MSPLIARPRLLLTLFCILLWTPGFFTLPPGDRDESRFAQATKQMLETGDFVRIMNGTEARNRKPIGIHWLQAPFVAAADAAGLAVQNPIWPYRLPSALGALVAVLATFWLGEALFGRLPALLGAALLAASIVLTVEAHIAKTDAALAGATVLFMAVLARAYLDPRAVAARHAALFWLALGASVLLKGPIGPMVACLTAAALVIADRRAAWLRALRPGWGVPLLLAVVLPWFVAIGAATGGKFFADAVGGDLGRKLSSGDDAHWGPPLLHLLLLPVLLFPATAALPGAAVQAWRMRATPAVRVLLAWIIPAWIVFEAVPTKLPHYTLPLYPALCLLAAQYAVATHGERLNRVLPAAVALLLAAASLALPVALHQPVWPSFPALIVGVAVAAGVLLWRQGALLIPLAAAPLVYWSVLGLQLPLTEPLWLTPRVAAVVPPGGFGAVGFAEPSLMFLAGTRTQLLLRAEGARALADGTLASLLVGDRDLDAVMQEAARLGKQPRVLAVIPGFNYSRGRPVTLTLLGP